MARAEELPKNNYKGEFGQLALELQGLTIAAKDEILKVLLLLNLTPRYFAILGEKGKLFDAFREARDAGLLPLQYEVDLVAEKMTTILQDYQDKLQRQSQLLGNGEPLTDEELPEFFTAEIVVLQYFLQSVYPRFFGEGSTR